MKLVDRNAKKAAKGVVLTQKTKYIIGVVVLVVLIALFGVLWYIEENADKPGAAAGIENSDGEWEDKPGGLQVEESGDGGTIGEPSGTGSGNGSGGGSNSGNGGLNSGGNADENDDKKDDEPSDAELDWGRVF